MPKGKPKKYYASSSESSDSGYSRSGSDSGDYASSYSSGSDRSPSPKRKTNKRAKSAYQFFCDVERKKIQHDHSSWALGKVSKELGKKWRNASDSVRSRYENKARKAKK